MEPHHIDPMSKGYAISRGMTSWRRILPELQKCVLLCANCHREVHDGMHPSYLEIDSPWARDDYWRDADLLDSD